MSEGGAEQCINCSSEIEGEPVYNGNSVKEGASDALEGGESVPITEVIEFNDGPYCSLDCSTDTAKEADQDGNVE